MRMARAMFRYPVLSGVCLVVALALHWTAPRALAQPDGATLSESQIQDSGRCLARSAALNRLKTNFRERPVGMGLANNGGVIELLRSPATGSWSLILTMPDGITCIVAAGENWESVAERTINARYRNSAF